MIKKLEKDDLEIVANLAVMLWPSHSVAELVNKFSEIMSNKKTIFYLKYEKDISVGFYTMSIRYNYVECTSARPVGYLEGIFMKEEYRNKGYAKELLNKCEK